MTRIAAPTRTHLAHVESRGWLLGKLGIGVLTMAGAVLVWGPLVAGRPHAMSLAGWLAWAAIALVILGAVVRVAEAVWGTACTAYVVVRHVTTALGSIAAPVGRATRSLAKLSRPLIATIAIILVAASSAWCQAIVLDLTNLVQNTISALKAI